MTQHTGIPSKYTKTLALSGTGVLALALLTGCSVADDGTPEADSGTSATAETSPTTAETSSPSATDDSGTPSASTTSPNTSTGAATTTGEDPIFAALDALLAEHSDAVIVQVDREDDDTFFDLEAVIGDRVVDFDVSTDGSVRENDDDDDGDDVRRAGEAQVTAEEAARAALEGRDGQSIDSMELDKDNGTLRWEVDLDRDGGDDGDELSVDAATGEVTQGH
ncbi:PepSY domain-containing protein [Citricoccus nitrophenolicus]|uniref:PepSY domain-containing protein n=1 Tax=Citricoccus nitrophenolicus TaxID=863575 RepID=A0ABV0INC8_9MICC